ncbi:MAG: hypothetical protein SF052_05010 [Bacteroidia bacterium]|nr:hypothetical protein [Bacteroidia bacterium]
MMVKTLRKLVEYLAIVILIGGIVIMIIMAGKFREHQKQETATKTEAKTDTATPSAPHLSEDRDR